MVIREIRPMDPLVRKLLPPQEPRPGVTYRPSVYALQADGLVWNTLTRQCLETDAGLPRTARAGEGLDELIRLCFLVPEDKDECRFYESLYAVIRAFNRREGYRGYTVLPTLGCNARCVYCYEQGMPQTAMTPETADRVVRFIRETHAEKTVDIGWFGGEPLLRPDIIDRICAGLADGGLAYRSTMITNASLVTEDILRRMTGPWRMQQVQVSADGAEADYKRRKRYYTDRDEYHRVLEAVDRMARAGIRTVVRCNVDAGNLDGLGSFLRDLCAAVGTGERKKTAVYFCPLNEVRWSENDLTVWSRLREIREPFREAGFTMADSILGRDRFRVFHCMADMNSPVIWPDGSLFLCEHCPENARFGDIWNNVTDAAAKEAFSRADRVREKCRRCPYLPLCTPFAACPVEDTHCREIRDLELPEYIRGLRKPAAQGEELTVC